MKNTLSLIALFTIVACTKPNVNSADDLHMSFVTPDWSRTVNCDQLNLYSLYINDSTSYVSASSASTLETFCFSIPSDSSQMAKPSNLKKFAIRNYFENNTSFEFSQKLPLNNGSALRLVSMDSVSVGSYNEVTEIKYLGNEAAYCLFKVSCKYAMWTKEVGNETNVKPVSGTFSFKVRTSRK